MQWSERSAIVTGGAGGLGAATVRRLTGLGMQVVVFDRALDAGNELVKDIGRGSAVGGDVNNDADVQCGHCGGDGNGPACGRRQRGRRGKRRPHARP
jgi:NAD(P)-dependent dehydrogenase (short-subunit alcohol dehydrogenase family)